MSEYRTGDLSLGRQAVLKDFRKYLRVPHATLIRSVFGSSPSNVWEIEDGRVLNIAPDGTTSQWAAFKVAPAELSASESETFQPLFDIVSKIFSQTPNCNVIFAAKPSTTPFSERQDTARPDAYVALERPAASGIHWFDIAIPFEFKKTNELRSQRDIRG